MCCLELAHASPEPAAAAASLDEAIARARELHLENCKLDVRMSNERAQRLYDRIGFEPHGVRRGYYQNPAEDALHMRLVLGC